MPVIERSTQLREPRRYFASAAAGASWKPVPREDLPFEFMMNALRLNEGFAPALFSARTGLPASSIEPTLRVLESQALMERDAATGAWRPTPRGRQLLNELVQRFLAGGNSEALASS